MAQPSTSTSTSTHNHLPSRPGFKRKHHTWHGPVTYRSHFQDFLHEIGEDERVHHLCCVPRQAHRHERTRASSEPMPLTIAEYSFLQAPSDSIPDGRPSLPKGRVVRRQSAPAATLATFSRPPREVVRPKLIIAKDSLKVRIPSKASATTSVDVQNRTPSSSYSLATVTQRLRTVMQIFDSRNRSPLPSGQVPEVDEDQGQWAPLPTSPALEPRKPALSQATSSVHSFSRAPSFASLDAASVTSSEGPETPPPTHSPLHEAMSPTLAVIEHTSRMRVPGTCVTCKRAGSNFPSCSTCGDTWCSRECRVAVGGRKHHCHRRAVGASASDDVQVPYVTAA